MPEEYEFALPFSLAPGEVAYVGRLKVTTETARNVFGMKIQVPGKLLLSSEPTEARLEAMRKCPESVRNSPIRDATLKLEMIRGNPVVRADDSR